MKKLKLLLVLIFPLILAACLGYTLADTSDDDVPDQIKETAKAEFTEKKYYISDLDRINILIMGVDAREGETQTRADTMLVASIDKTTDQVVLLSIPRDSRIIIPGYGRMRINQANPLGGTDLVEETVESLLDLKIHYYVKTNFQGFKEVVDALGGVEIDVDKNMYYQASDIRIALKKGPQHLDGEEALNYVRFRHEALGDISRTQRQQKMLKALAEESLQWSNLPKLPKLIPALRETVETDLTTKELFYLAALAKQLDEQDIITQTLPGSFPTSGVGYWKVDQERAKTVVEELFNGQKMATIEQS